jgi:hypothetical protein
MLAETFYSFDFDHLKSGNLGISAVYASFAEAASYCLHLNQHSNPVQLSLTGDVSASGAFRWSDIDERHSKTWADTQEATEYGAYGVAIVIAARITGIPYVERAAKPTGIDYWLGDGSDEDGVFQRTAQLEVSGILNGDEIDIRARLNAKLLQTKRSDQTCLPAYAGIVEFGSPEARLVKRTPAWKQL